MIDVRLNLLTSATFRPATDMDAVHPVVPYAQHGFDVRRRSAGLTRSIRPVPRGKPEGDDHLVDEWA
ncbi:hypothetical protein J2T57_000225 [Natronocella acetinitrilica]|uniref:Uncharacterized protein n=1 Tax=Natronocella acetinitrilica TaxID=414046 RepID=A0AAE3G0Z6_9GAMM|nr:hypothetical protein [Natronocella acetinitrilica]MCP1673133.1 hypothetical protein [Natronocella acetinitrilica]